MTPEVRGALDGGGGAGAGMGQDRARLASGGLWDAPEPDATVVDLFGTPEPEPPKWTERAILDLLVDRYGKVIAGNGPRYAYAEHVNSAAGFDARRCMDFLAMSLWPSDGLALHGHEVKVSRADWRTELKDPEKAEAFRPYMDFWWLVVSDRAIVRDDLPDGWGLMAVGKAGLRVVKQAPRLDPEPMPKTMQAALLRSVQRTTRRATLRERGWT